MYFGNSSLALTTVTWTATQDNQRRIAGAVQIEGFERPLVGGAGKYENRIRALEGIFNVKEAAGGGRDCQNSAQAGKRQYKPTAVHQPGAWQTELGRHSAEKGVRTDRLRRSL